MANGTLKDREKYWIRWPGNMSHGGSDLPEFYIWCTMRQRCSNPKNHKYHRYGGRGIKFCARWSRFEAFLSDMGRRPTPQHTLDRINNDGNYEPGNVRWATRHQQARNRMTNHFLEYRGRRATIAEWSEITGIRYGNIKNRINNLKWSVRDALTIPNLPYGTTR